MTTRRTTLEEQYNLILECRKSGLSDRDWCFSKGIPQSTFYLWLRKLRNAACYEIPETNSKNIETLTVVKQDVVKLNRYPENPIVDHLITQSVTAAKAPITIEIDGIRLNVENTADPSLLAQTLKMIRGFLC